MAPKFGTSGLRGLVTELTPALVADYVRAFLAACPTGGGLHVGRDLRDSSPDIAAAVIAAARGAGVPVTDCGVLPTPALALASLEAGQGAIMVTGSHIPADRNGLKFYVPTGEIAKSDEAAIAAALGSDAAEGSPAPVVQDDAALARYRARYADAYGPTALSGLRVGVYQHSSVARDVLPEILTALGAEAVALARSGSFVPVDTEALDPDTRGMLAGWCAEHGLDAVVSTDGDADRPMVADAEGRVVPGDVLGVLTARALGARILCTPVSSNSMITEMPDFAAIRRTRIGSPFVIAAMEDTLAAEPTARVVGYEANGGFLLGFRAAGPAGPLAPLMTRDCLLPIVAPLAAAAAAGLSLAELGATLPPRFTAADRLQDVPAEASRALIDRLSEDDAARAAFFADVGPESHVDLTDGLRVSFSTGVVVHLRPSGNAPECRVYAEAETEAAATALVADHLARLKTALAA
ncbi:Phosphoglucosamine mutase [Roseivivax jejudonensis]|uniref:Phosphoglucosamine mutase n=1 Tax=Roseivivax jejudonensis TaxID=1529041 RepID=A0A1X6ZKM0_9RHOB|nr:phosphomannomutase [Roseivivax jejudonensis]SLN53701.1 Phosphoglucosamine mutase [Roseivivax jejudonensis]